MLNYNKYMLNYDIYMLNYNKYMLNYIRDHMLFFERSLFCHLR